MLVPVEQITASTSYPSRSTIKSIKELMGREKGLLGRAQGYRQYNFGKPM
jgi:hypothetical protein